MSDYKAPLAEMRFVINEVADLASLNSLPGLGEATPDLVDAILEEAGKFAADVFAPLNRSGDRAGCVLEDGEVRTPKGFKEAYADFVRGGWNGVPFDAEYGGQGLPWLASAAISEIWNAANMSLALCPLLTQSAIELLTAHASAELKSMFLPRLVAGEWTGAMNLTEPQAGSDLAAIRCKATVEGDHYKITGQKIFISYGDHDFGENIVHMVLARLAGAAEGIKGLSLFVVPKFMVNKDGSLGTRNAVRCLSLEHKMGLHASPTAVMSYDGAFAYLIGEENRGLEYMFTMMNNARLAVGLEGVAIAERAYQQARAYAFERVQGRVMGSDGATIAGHPDVKRMLLSMKAETEAARALAYFAAAALDKARRHPDQARRRYWQTLVDLLIPVVKAWCADAGIRVADTGIQVHGGGGYIEETGAAQYFRDVRVTSIYEGTNGIQAADLAGRKVARDGGAAAYSFIAMMRETVGELKDEAIRNRLNDGVNALARATDRLVGAYAKDRETVAAGAVHYLRLFGNVSAGRLMAQAAHVAQSKLDAGGGDPVFLNAKIISARFFADQVMAQSDALADIFINGAAAITAARKEHL
ncbi:MAG: acyl-CoA dehydrogenase [Rhodospirillales bacterium RIFCSPLOWO2_12_FULL_58_28]|nr:MAG: acyl-CoA dehydrogenase [Rhodospirillales bacterium RIFCSPLOWO2_02_FULL_58_16]OHC78547.1 MAG: acyl-CoA dehydrogenase [Rhodospirillales bacterium RIFCSPLOWO2_12_FULL_58_28]